MSEAFSADVSMRGKHGNHVRGEAHPQWQAWRPFCNDQWLRTRYVVDGASQAEIARDAGVSLKRVQTAMRHYGIEARRPAKREQRGAANASWAGDKATYAAFHKRVERERGKPLCCTRCETAERGRIYEWANLTGRYEDINDYERMCRSCHRRYDVARRAMREGVV